MKRYSERAKEDKAHSIQRYGPNDCLREVENHSGIHTDNSNIGCTICGNSPKRIFKE